MPRLIICDSMHHTVTERAADMEARLPFISRFAFTFGDYCGGPAAETVVIEKNALLARDRLSMLTEIPFSAAGAFAKSRSLYHAQGLAFDLTVPGDAKRRLIHTAIAGCGFRILPPALSGTKLTLLFPLPFRVLEMGSANCGVCLLQRLLCELGYLRRPVDGRFGVDTLYALRRFRRANGLPDSDAVFPCELAALLRLTTLSPDATMGW